MRLWAAFLAVLFGAMAFVSSKDDPAYWSWVILCNVWAGVALVLRALARPTHTNDRGES